MPRQRRRHHSRSRSRSRSYSHDRDREVKRRRIDSGDEGVHRRSLSPDARSTTPDSTPEQKETTMMSTKEEALNVEDTENKKVESDVDDSKKDEIVVSDDSEDNNTPTTTPTKPKSTPAKALTPKQLRRKVESEKKREQKQKEKEERERKRLEEKEERKRQKQEKEDQKKKEREEKEELRRKEREEKEEQKRKEREEKEEQKRKEREEKEEQKRKEREQKELKRQQEIEEKNKDKRKKEELQEKAAAAFANFFVTKKPNVESKKPNESSLAFMPFEVKADMRLAPVIRIELNEEQKDELIKRLEKQDSEFLYLEELKTSHNIRKSGKTWPVEDNEVVVVEENDGIGECVEEDHKVEKMKAKLLQFCDNRRPAYFGTWRKVSKCIGPRRPLATDSSLFDYEVDSDDDWEEEEPGESLKGSDDEEKEEPDDYEVDNEFFVPHGYLSDEEIDNEEKQIVSPETQKHKLDLLKIEFDEEMKSKTEKIKPRIIGCIWEDKLAVKIDNALQNFLNAHRMYADGPIVIKKRELIPFASQKSKKSVSPQKRRTLDKVHVPDFLKLLHGNTRNQNSIIGEFLHYLEQKDVGLKMSKAGLCNQLKQLAKWMRCRDEGPMFNKYCWYVNEDIQKEYDVELNLPNSWNFETASDEKNV